MPILNARYKISLYNTAKYKVAEFDDFRSLQIFQQVNGRGSFTYIMSGFDSRTALITSDGFFEAWRTVPGLLSSYVEFGGLVEDTDDRVFQNGNHQFTTIGCSYNGLLARRYIMWRVGTEQALKATTPGSAMYYYVLENLGANATVAAGRVGNGSIPNLSYNIGDVAAPVWRGDRALKNLLATLQEIADYGGVDFELLSLAPIAGIPAWQFHTQAGQIGLDRSTAGLVPATGLNAAGNVPVIFSLEQGNVESMALVEKHSREINVAFGLGSGSGTGQEIIERPAALPTIGISRREGVRSGNVESTAGLQALADGLLNTFQDIERLDFRPLQQRSTLYGLHYSLGDTVTGRWTRSDGTILENHKRITAVRITVGRDGKERLDFTFQDVP